mmetsp:Transcript_64612/g.203969  ORF Transcript_64612/g.203969 Transcript_64612/m.203969 type:complete len:555 (+) Transcript_64612:459-2123(+)
MCGRGGMRSPRAEGDRKAFYETSQWTMKQNMETISNGKKENKELRAQLAALTTRKGREANTNNAAVNPELRKLAAYVDDLRKRCDDIVQVSDRLHGKLNKMTDGMKDLERDAVRALDEDSPMTRHIRMLENRLDKALIKYNEAQSIRRTYEQIVKRLKEERVGFDNQLAAIERTLKAKERDLEELILMSHDANHAKDVSKAELAKVDAQLHQERVQREKELSERRAQVRAKQEMTAKIEAREKEREGIKAEAAGDLSANEENAMKTTLITNSLFHASNVQQMEEEQKKITTFGEAFRKIKEATGVSDVSEVIQKFMTQEDTNANLKQMTKEAQARIDKLNEEKAAAKARVEELKYSGSGSSGSRRIVDEYETHLGESNSRCERSKQKYERVAKTLIKLKAGTEHLAEKVQDIKVDGQPIIPLTDETVCEVLQQCEQKLLKGLEQLSADDLERVNRGTTYNIKQADMPSTNMRITTGMALGLDDDDEEEESDDDNDHGDVPDREYVKSSAQKVTDKESYKKKKKTRGFEDSTPVRPKAGGGAVKGGAGRARPAMA